MPPTPTSPTHPNTHDPTHITLGLPAPATVQRALRIHFSGLTPTTRPTWFRCPLPIPGTVPGTLCHAPAPARLAGVLAALCDLTTALQNLRPIDREVGALAHAMVCRHHRCRAGALGEKLRERIGRYRWGKYLGDGERGEAEGLERERKTRARRRAYGAERWEGVMRVREGVVVNGYLRAEAEGKREEKEKLMMEEVKQVQRERTQDGTGTGLVAGVALMPVRAVWVGTSFVVGAVLSGGKAVFGRISEML